MENITCEVFEELPRGRGSSPGVYIIEHEKSQSFYIGSTENSTVRKAQHVHALRNGTSAHPLLQKAFSDGSEPSFTFIPTETREEAYDYEQKLLDHHRGDPRLLNVATDARKSSKGIPHSEDHKAKIAQSNLGRRHTEESKAKISTAKTGHATEAQRQHLVSLNQSRAGIPLSEEHRQNISNAQLGKTFSEDHKNKIGSALAGKKKSAEHVTKVVEARKGFTQSAEARAKIAAGVAAARARKKLESTTQS